ncbi:MULTISPECIES: arylamine N-acetyltransferase [Thalassospira]|mgnify:FL=1|uniref:arylamine N-acetyltransferase family protein n=1 Tax=Thalassospira TaxID=168934 RepID=UPI0009F3EFCF|nr:MULTISPECIES: arylamine N-acetyltransferase [Thalassospira]MAB33792.1 arylamine N-acetyltransferase [Thalassospira sp.]MDM7977109.1 arylamine N-acetyltransferase [Thalassospira xiamenensis]HBS23375.1 arylamine N-acetyltransferase [Thalassospira sp.]
MNTHLPISAPKFDDAAITSSVQNAIDASWAKPFPLPEPQVDLDAYFARIGYDGPREATLEVLRDLHALHPAHIPFEAINVLCRKGVSLAPEDIDRKIILEGRGGYCFEQNGLFRRVLRSLGFEVESLAGRVLWGYNEGDGPRPRCHMAMRVTLDGEAWLVDVGLGGCVPTAPLLLGVSVPQVTPHDTFRVRERNGRYLTELERDGVWKPVHEVDIVPVEDIDYEVMNFYASTHPESGFAKVLMVARSAPHARFTLLNNRLTIRLRTGEEEVHHLSVGDVEQTLSDIFGITVDPAWRTYLEDVIASAEAVRKQG